MHESFDLNIRRLVATINAFEGLAVIGGCAGHPDPQLDQWPEGAWYVMFIVQQTDQGWFALEFWPGRSTTITGAAATRCCSRRSRQRPTFLNQANRPQVAIEGSAGADATILATWLSRLRAECYVAPWSGQVTNGTTGRSVRRDLRRLI
jgi:hypothetical protein